MLIPGIIVLISVVLNLCAVYCRAFADFYTQNIFPLWQESYGRLTSLASFSVGEVLIAIGVAFVPLSLIVTVILLIIKKGRRGKVIAGFFKTYFWILSIICLIQTLNCFILYRSSIFAERNNINTSKHTRQELEKLGNRLVNEINSAAKQVKRDDKGKFILTADIDKTAAESMKNLSSKFKGLDGYYVKPKPIRCSFFMSQMNLMGIYFPFSMEANFNNDMFKAKLPDTVCHELAHTKGYIREDEANFIAFMACVESDNGDYRYSGYLSALTEVRNKIFEYADNEQKIDFDSKICNEVWADMDANREYWKSVEEKEDTVFNSESVAAVSDKAMETSLKANGVDDGKRSYGRMVDLMIDFYNTTEE